MPAVERVGGGYDIEYLERDHLSSPRRGIPQAPTGAMSSVVKEFDAPGVRAVEVLQGGATIWTAEEDGTITLRNGFTGDVAHKVPAQGAGLVERLFATTDLMWVGFNDGSIRVYDHLVVEKEWPSNDSEPKPHQGPVRFFCALYDDSILSGSTDGQIIKWAGSSQRAEEDPEAPPQYSHLCTATTPAPLSSLEAYSTFVFAGDHQGHIHVYDAESLELINSFEAHPSATVTCLKYMDGMLFSGGSDGNLRAWASVSQRDREPGEITIGEGLHDCAIRKLIADPRAHQMWSIDEKGTLNKWESTAPFGLRNSTAGEGQEGGDGAPLECGAFQDMACLAAWDAVRVWSTGSNGVNFCWFAQWNRAEEQMQEAIEAMNYMIENDQTMLAHWQKHIDKINDVDKKRKTHLALVMASSSDKVLLETYRAKWVQWLNVRHTQRTRVQIAQSMEQSHRVANLLRVYYDKLLNWRRCQRQARAAAARTQCITHALVKGLRRRYWIKLESFCNKKRQESLRQRAGEGLLMSTSNGLRRIYLRKWLRFLHKRRQHMKRVNVASALLRSTEVGLTRVYYFKWLNFRALSKQQATKRHIAEMLQNIMQRDLRRQFFFKFLAFGEESRQKVQAERMSTALKESRKRHLLAVYQQKCDDWAHEQEKTKARAHYQTRNEYYKELLAKQEAEKERMKRIEELEKKKQHRMELEKRREELKARLGSLQEQRDQLKKRISDKEEAEKRVKEARETLNDTMAKLKELSLNFEGDYQMISKMWGKCDGQGRGAPPPVKYFKENHLEIKRRAHGDSLSNEKWDPDVDGGVWPIYGRYKKIATVDYNIIAKAIKCLVISFDMMTLKDLNELGTDDEVVVNAEHLINLYLNCLRVKQRKQPQEFKNPNKVKKEAPKKESPKKSPPAPAAPAPEKPAEDDEEY
eukprot:TRINITY_DN32065_c0_g1_i1.p1 TRINITY_DN32065_c0_g1~~TRINITY_DN32065_c0_g1_i1.p1  ORF type:complete len:919 (+),score=450.28 TRINITY_DN32065_c0_g1_i1:44-2800(+)